jgi:tetratricopeptide (TPR) repeat protein
MLSALLPSAWRERRERRQALRELRQIDTIESDLLALRDDNPLYRAKVSLEIGDPAAAREFFEEARKRIPRYVLTCPDTIEVMLNLKEFDELDAFALKGAKLFRKEPHYLEGYAESAQRRRNLDEAVRRWAMVRKKFPHRRLSYICGVGCLRELGRLDEADRLMTHALGLMPNDMALLIEYCRVPEARGDWEEALRRWNSIRDRHPMGYMGAAVALQNLGRVEEADALLAEGRFRYPIETVLAVAQAQLSERAGNIPEALKRLAVVRQRFPFSPIGYGDAIRLLRDQKSWAEADEVALAAVDRFPDDSRQLAQYAQLAQDRQDWAEAAKRWAAVKAAFPDRTDAARMEAQALAAAGASSANAQGATQTSTSG